MNLIGSWSWILKIRVISRPYEIRCNPNELIALITPKSAFPKGPISDTFTISFELKTISLHQGFSAQGLNILHEELGAGAGNEDL
jgi:hypothetical protein